MQNRRIIDSRRFMQDIQNKDMWIHVGDSCRAYEENTYKSFVDSCSTYEKYICKIDTYKILVDSCRTYEIHTHNCLWIHEEHTKNTSAK